MEMKALVPMLHVRSVPSSIAFYARLGFAVRHTHAPEGDPEPVWAWITSGGAQLMLAQSGEPVDPAKQAVLFYVYCPDVPGLRDTLVAAGIAAGAITYPFYSPRGEFRVADPDGYDLTIAHT